MSHNHPVPRNEVHVLARHPNWSGTLCFDEAAGRVRLAANNAHASYSTMSGGILLIWDDFPAEHFLPVDGSLVHSSLVHHSSTPDVSGDTAAAVSSRSFDTVTVRVPGTDIAAALRWPGRDCEAFQRIFQTWKLGMASLPATASTVVDIGAGVGLASLFFAHQYPKATIYSIEPDAVDNAVLLRNMAQMGGRCVVVETGDDRTPADKPGPASSRAISDLLRRLGIERIDILRIGGTVIDEQALSMGRPDWLDAVGTIVVDDALPSGTGRDDVVRLIRNRGFGMPRRCGDAEVFVRPALGHAGCIAVRPSRRTVVVTPYFNEDAHTLRRCIESVLGQNLPTEHLLVADGHPQSWLDDMPVRHLKLDRAHGDYGNTPRGMGALMAISEDYDAIAFLDADNWLEPDHVERCYASADAMTDVDYVVARWNLCRPDRTIIRIASQPGHVDTNCFFFLPGSYHLIPHFSMMPRQLSPLGDRIFYAAVQAAGLTPAETDRATVNYTCLWSSTYQAIGEEPPSGAKPNIDSASIDAWLKARTPRALDIVARRAGVRIT